MTITEPIAQTPAATRAAIAELHELFDLQRAAFLRDTYPSVADRRARLEALMGMVDRQPGRGSTRRCARTSPCTPTPSRTWPRC